MPTPLFPTFEKRIVDATEHLLHTQIDPWIFFHRKLEVKKFDGSVISYQGIQFEGNPRQVFWSRYIEPFLEDMVVKELTASVLAAKKHGANTKELLSEINSLLISSVTKVFARMADIDQRLRGNGYPDQVTLRSTQKEYEQMEEFITKHTQAQQALSRIIPTHEKWIDKHKTLAFVIGIAISIVGLIAQFI